MSYKRKHREDDITVVVPTACAAALDRTLRSRPRAHDEALLPGVADAIHQTLHHVPRADHERVESGHAIALSLNESQRAALVAFAGGETATASSLHSVKRRLHRKVRKADARRRHNNIHAARGARMSQSFGVATPRRQPAAN